jgi:hypothetical protein
MHVQAHARWANFAVDGGVCAFEIDRRKQSVDILVNPHHRIVDLWPLWRGVGFSWEIVPAPSMTKTRGGQRFRSPNPRILVGAFAYRGTGVRCTSPTVFSVAASGIAVSLRSRASATRG